MKFTYLFFNEASHWSGNNFALKDEKRIILAAFSKWRVSSHAIFINDLLRVYAFCLMYPFISSQVIPPF